MDKRLRDLIWLAVLALVLAVWGWDRGRLAMRLEPLSVDWDTYLAAYDGHPKPWSGSFPLAVPPWQYVDGRAQEYRK